jgi:hypothetical protein
MPYDLNNVHTEQASVAARNREPPSRAVSCWRRSLIAHTAAIDAHVEQGGHGVTRVG